MVRECERRQRLCCLGRVAAAPELAATRRPLREAKRQPLIEDCDVRARDCVPMHGRVHALLEIDGRRTREKSPRAASLRILAEEPDVDPARVPEATGAPIRRHRRRDRNRLDGVGDQPPPSR